MPNRHPDLDRILGLARGERAAAEESGHLTACDRCAGSLAWARELLRAAAAPALDDPPRELLERAGEIAREAGARARRPTAGLSLARLVGGLLARPAAAGVRGPARASRRLYESEGAHVDLEIGEAAEDAELCRVTGQLLDPEGETADALAILWRGGSVAAHSAADEAGAFVFPSVPPGTYRLEVWSPERMRVVRVDPLELP
jgi:hypothetical protein